jgi:hypothetical protein
MWMDVYVQQILVRQQIAESDRAAAVRHQLCLAKSAHVRRPWRLVVQRLVRSAVRSRRWRTAERVAVR